ncbi:dihydropteroate synthase [Sphingobacterium hungaricum]|uniref:Dihydropteroate synthase n=1 Tax=Sphingobacterium hungaricum TaxID=2082723 RepID=A0A928UZG5_9SPHI|nr:dihydropteroate synthase [Sphingobacterium hungaricum]MBE8713404.1 dihydropteroate synthase [Sphingobacterium hungaricum]
MSTLHTHSCQSIVAGGKLISFELPKIMAILNLTPDSFYDGGKYNSIEHAVAKAEELLNQGADIIDIGAFSSRPGAKLISAQEEMDRALPIIEEIVLRFPQALLSIDTFRSEVAETAIKAGVQIINDVSGGTIDENMFDTVAKLQVPYVLMHMRGLPETMQNETSYDDIVTDVATYFGEKISKLRSLGVKDIVLDPGFGFAKTQEQNYELLHRVDELHYFGLPILGGISRKSMIHKKLNIQPDESLIGTTVLNTLLLLKGVQILRVHDMKEAKQIVDLLF